MAEKETTIYDTYDQTLYKKGIATYSSDLPAKQVTANSLFSATVDEVAQTPAAGTTTLITQASGGQAAGKTKFDNTEVGYILGIDSSVPKFYIGNTTNYLNWTGTQLIISGNISATTGSIGGFTISATALYAGDGATKIQLDTTQGIFLGANTFASAPFSVSLAGALIATNATITGAITATSGSFTGSITATAGTIGGFTITSNSLYGSTIKTAATVGIGSDGVIMDTAGLRGYSIALGNTFNIPTDGSAPTFSSGIINYSIFNVNVNAAIQTSATVGDGSANSHGIKMTPAGFYACEDNQTLANANVRILVDGSGYFSGDFEIGGAVKTISDVADIQNALDAVELAGGGTVYLKSGTYTLTSDILISGGVNLEGTSREDCIIECGIYSVRMSGSNVYSTGTVTINNGDTTVVGSGTTFTSGMVGEYIWLDYSYYLITTFTDTTHIEIDTYEGTNLAGENYVIATVNFNPKITKLTIQNSTGAGIQSQYCNNPQLNDLNVYGCNIGIDIDYVEFPEILSYTIENGVNLDINYATGVFVNYSSFDYSTSGEGMKLSNVVTSSMYNSTSSGNTTNGITLTNCYDNTIFDTNFSSNGGNGASLTDCSNGSFISISFNSNGSNGIEFISNNNDFQISETQINGNTSDGIKLTATSDRNSIVATTISNNGGYGINIAASTCNNNQIVSPAFDNNASGNINDGGTGTTVLGLANLAITYTGTPRFPILFNIVQSSIAVIPTVAGSGQEVYSAIVGPTIMNFSYNEGNAVTGNTILTLSFDDLVGISQNFEPSSLALITSLSLPLLKNVVGSFTPSEMASLTTLSIPSLEYCGVSFSIQYMDLLTSLVANSLRDVGGFTLANMAVLASISFPALTSITSSVFSNISSLTNITIDSLKTMDSVIIQTMSSLTTISFAGLISVKTNMLMSTSNGAITTVTLGTVGTLKSIGGNINISGQALTAATVNGILALLVSLDGTNGTTTWGTGQTVNLSGGTSSAPTGQGLTDKATLQARGATVTTN